MIIGIGYQARSGKDTVADLLCREYNFLTTAFAYSLKEGAQAVFGLTYEQVYRDKEVVDPFWDDTPRNILQKFGTECVRAGYRDDVWIKRVQKRVLVDSPDADWIITDVRFPNEAVAIKSWGGRLINIMRPLETGRTEIATKTHISETALVDYQGWDHRIRNDGTIQDLYHRVRELMELWGVPHANPKE